MPERVNRDQTKEMVRQGAVLVEVLGRKEYQEEHIPGALNLPLTELDRERAGRLDPQKNVVLYCGGFL